MTEARRQLIEALERDADRMVGILGGFVAVPSPNPPGDTRDATAYLTELLDAEGVPYRIVAPRETMPNILGGFDGAAGPGPHLVLNGHIDVFPAGDPADWSVPPWSGAVIDGRVWGRGVTDMKAGTVASVMTYVHLHRLRAHLPGRLTLTAVSDEETGGKWGARYLLEQHGDEVRGDAVLNGEPSDPRTVRFCEKGTLRLTFTVRTPGAHGAYPNKSRNANRIAGHLMDALDRLAEMVPEMPESLAGLLRRDEIRARIDAAMGAGTAAIVDKVTVNYGVLRGGLKVNLLPGTCVMEVDIRLPIGLDRAAVLARIDTILEAFPEVTLAVQEAASNAASYSDPGHPLVGLIRRNARELGGHDPLPIPSLGASDCKHFRHHGVPSFLYGVPAGNMGRADESVAVEDFLHVVRTHAVTAFDYLTGAEA